MSGEGSGGVLLGIDLGGTQIKTARFSSAGEWESESQASSHGHENPKEIFGALYSAASDLIGDNRLAGVGICVAGVFDPQSGKIVNSPNMPTLNGFDLREWVRSAFGEIPIHMMNDANAAALGEFHAGAGTGAESMFLLTLGTGVGGGFVIGGEIWEGVASVAGEVGHMCIQADGPLCNCGAKGCLEAFISSWALIRDANAIARKKPGSAIAGLPSLTPEDLAALAAQGDEDANALWEKAGTMLGIGIASLMNLLNPERIVLAGGLAKAGDLLLKPAENTWKIQAFDRAHETTSVRMGTLGEWAGVRGAVQPLLNQRLLKP